MDLVNAPKPFLFRLDELMVRQKYSTYRSVRRLLIRSTVCVNGVQVIDAGTMIDPRYDVVTVDGEVFPLKGDIYLMMNKKQDTVCTSDEGQHERVFQSISPEYINPEFLGKLHTVGRLDLDTEGLLILTTNGKLSHWLTDPMFHHTKKYFVCLRDELGAEEKREYERKIAEGFYIEPEKKAPAFICKPAEILWIDDAESNPYCNLKTSSDEMGYRFTACVLTLTEGKFHQVKRMFSTLGNHVVFLKRISMGRLYLDTSLKCGEYRHLTEEELEMLLTV